MSKQLQRSFTLDSYIVTPHQLSEALQKNVNSKLSTAPRVIPLCAAWFLPNDPQKRQGIDCFKQKRIPTARFFDIDKVSDTSSPYPHMLPSPEVFAEEVGKLGIRRDDTVVVYDTAELGIFSAPRVAWTFKIFGHPSVHILNNFKIWAEKEMPLEEGEPHAVQAESYPVPELDKSKIMSYEELKERLQEQGKEGAEPIIVLDARSKGRFDGTDPEPRPGKFNTGGTTTAHIDRGILTRPRPLIRSHARRSQHPIHRCSQISNQGISAS